MTNIGTSSRYLIKLFFKTKPKYRCSRTKINKLLSIANFVSIKKNNQMFKEIMSVDQCGTSFPVISWIFREDIMDGINDERFSIIDEDCIDESATIPLLYECESECYFVLDAEEEQLLKAVFLNFGASSAKTIGLEINEFINEVSTVSEFYKRPIIDYEKAEKFFKDDKKLENYSENKIVEFINEIIRHEKIENCTHLKKIVKK